jgi:hypothetical protein
LKKQTKNIYFYEKLNPICSMIEEKHRRKGCTNREKEDKIDIA